MANGAQKVRVIVQIHWPPCDLRGKISDSRIAHLSEFADHAAFFQDLKVSLPPPPCLLPPTPFQGERKDDLCGLDHPTSR